MPYLTVIIQWSIISLRGNAILSKSDVGMRSRWQNVFVSRISSVRGSLGDKKEEVEYEDKEKWGDNLGKKLFMILDDLG